MQTTIENGKLILLRREEYELSEDLDLRGTQITALPEGLTVSGEIYKDF